MCFKILSILKSRVRISRNSCCFSISFLVQAFVARGMLHGGSMNVLSYTKYLQVMNLHVYDCSQLVAHRDLSTEMVTTWQVVHRPPLTKGARFTINIDANSSRHILSKIYPTRWAESYPLSIGIFCCKQRRKSYCHLTNCRCFQA